MRNIQDVAARLLRKSALGCRSCGERFYGATPGEPGANIVLNDNHLGLSRCRKWLRSARGRRALRTALIVSSALAAVVLFLIGIANVGPS